VLSRFTLLELDRVRVAFDHPDWLFQLKYAGFRAVLYFEPGQARIPLATKTASP